MPRKRSHGDGSLSKRADGRWQASLMHEGRRAYVYGRTEREARAKLAELRRQRDRGVEVDRRLSVAQFLTRWLADVIDPQRSPGTARAYRQVATRFIVPALGSIPLAGLSPMRVQTFKRQLLTDGLSPSYVRLTLATLSSAMKTAEQWRLIEHNPTRVIEKPAQGKRALELTALQAATLAQQFHGHRYEAAVRLAMELGLRASEVTALRWQDVDLEAGLLAVTGKHGRPLSAGSGPRLVRSETKPGRPRPALPLSPQLVRILCAQRQRQRDDAAVLGPAWQDSGLVITKEDGTGVWTETLRRHVARAGVSFHFLRHAASTVMHELGVSAETRAEILGHTTPRLTSEVYTHVGAAALRQAVEGVAAALSADFDVRIDVNGAEPREG